MVVCAANLQAPQDKDNADMRKLMILCTIGLLLSGCRLGGTASGISEPVELLETVSQQSLTLTKDGPFAFEQTLKPGTAYNVEATAPKGQLCKVSNAEGTMGRNPVTNLQVACEPDTIACTMEYAPVCAKSKADIACVTTPCPDHAYRTFPNACHADAVDGMISFTGSCDNLEEALAFEDKPALMLEALQDNPDARPFTLLGSRIDGDVAHLTLQYSGGCGDHDVQLQVAQQLLPGQPVVAHTKLIHTSNDNCDALITREHRFDLLPVKAFYQRQFDQTSGRVAIQNIGNYVF